MNDLIQDIKQIGASKGTRFQSWEYLEYLRSLPCAVSGCGKSSTADHLVHGRRTLSSDLLTLNLCLEHHLLRQNGGNDTGSKLRKENWSLLILENIQNFLAIKGLATVYKVDHKRVNRDTKKAAKSKKANREPYVSNCNTRNDFSRYNPT